MALVASLQHSQAIRFAALLATAALKTGRLIRVFVRLERAASLYLMASNAFGRGEPEFAEVLIQKANQYVDQAVGLQSCGGEQRQQTCECCKDATSATALTEIASFPCAQSGRARQVFDGDARERVRECVLRLSSTSNTDSDTGSSLSTLTVLAARKTSSAVIRRCSRAST